MLCSSRKSKSPTVLCLVFYGCSFLLCLNFLDLAMEVDAHFEPTWDSLDKHKLPAWYDEAKFGIFMHWGVYSVPSFDSEWFWWHWKGNKPYKSILDFMKKNYIPGFRYADFAPMFKAEFFNPDEWADLLKASGARYFVFTSKHHEGFTNWKSNVSWNWNSVDAGPHIDIVDALGKSIRNRTDIRFGLYYSLYEWFNPVFLKDKSNQFNTDHYIKEIMLPQLYDIVMKYKPEYIWSDGDWDTDYRYWKSREFLAWLYNESPVKDTVLVNDRWGIGTMCKHGDTKTCADRFNPGKLLPFKWENAMTIDKKSWGYRREAKLEDYFDTESLIEMLVRTVRKKPVSGKNPRFVYHQLLLKHDCGGNLLLNIGPTHDGRIVPIFEERLRQIGAWLEVNGEAIYKTKPWKAQNDTVTPNVWYTSKENFTVFAIVTKLPSQPYLYLSAPIAIDSTSITLLGLSKSLMWSKAGAQGIYVNIHEIPFSDSSCKWAWTFMLKNVS